MRAIDGLDLQVERGEIYGFLGRNGAGKTTAIRMLMGILKPDAGEIVLLGARTTRPSVEQKQNIGYVSQEQFFYPWMTCKMIGEFVSSFYPSWNSNEYQRLLQILELPPDRKTAALSQGMRTKLALALALAPGPPLLILDEPTSGLDPVARREFLDIIVAQSRRQGRTVFFSSHLIDEVERVADRIGIIDRGRLLYQGDVPALRSSVRKVFVPKGSGSNVPPGFRLLRREEAPESEVFFLYAPPELWEQVRDQGLSSEELPLLDIFVALVGRIGP